MFTSAWLAALDVHKVAVDQKTLDATLNWGRTRWPRVKLRRELWEQEREAHRRDKYYPDPPPRLAAWGLSDFDDIEFRVQLRLVELGR